MCRGGAFNLSFESLTSRECREALRQLKKIDPEFYAELVQSESGQSDDTDLVMKGPVMEDATEVDTGNDDDTSLPFLAVVNHVHGNGSREVLLDAAGNLAGSRDAESVEIAADDGGIAHLGEVGIVDENGKENDGGDEVLGRGKRIKKASRHYPSDFFWRH